MTTTTMQTIDRRARTSDGTITCCMCREIIESGDSYMQDTCADSGITIERDVCRECWTAKSGGDAMSWICVIAAVVIILAVYAAMVG